jgi:hypothetical protein
MGQLESLRELSTTYHAKKKKKKALVILFDGKSNEF